MHSHKPINTSDTTLMGIYMHTFNCIPEGFMTSAKFLISIYLVVKLPEQRCKKNVHME